MAFVTWEMMYMLWRRRETRRSGEEVEKPNSRGLDRDGHTTHRNLSGETHQLQTQPRLSASSSPSSSSSSTVNQAAACAKKTLTQKKGKKISNFTKIKLQTSLSDPVTHLMWFYCLTG
ncbi:hypothetical protein OS493_009963 [Desmophyllum pertusum]|uniref:Uncharacterized protein n=1 Tax=Desmophyllum pertusum TaxID=174260 RepID=A0A9W9YHG4_9CNID|nr:hypothetical protein OS493_009963 [Desmophyllum pertusum]